MIEFENVTKAFGGLIAVNDCSFTIPTGEITGLIGPNGAGKTTAFNIIAGLYYPTSGRVLFDGTDISRLKAHARQRLGLARTFQLAHEFSKMTVLENLMVAASHPIGESVFAAVFSPGRYQKEEREAHSRALEILEFLEIPQLKDEMAGNLSGGQKKLLELGRTMMSDPDIVLLDEPGAGVNPTLMVKLADDIQRLNEERGYTFCIIEHDMDLVEKLCHPIIVMAEGAVLAQGSMADIRRNQEVLDAYLGGGRSARLPQDGTSA